MCMYIFGRIWCNFGFTEFHYFYSLMCIRSKMAPHLSLQHFSFTSLKNCWPGFQFACDWTLIMQSDCYLSWACLNTSFMGLTAAFLHHGWTHMNSMDMTACFGQHGRTTTPMGLSDCFLTSFNWNLISLTSFVIWPMNEQVRHESEYASFNCWDKMTCDWW